MIFATIDIFVTPLPITNAIRVPWHNKADVTSRDSNALQAYSSFQEPTQKLPGREWQLVLCMSHRKVLPFLYSMILLLVTISF